MRLILQSKFGLVSTHWRFYLQKKVNRGYYYSSHWHYLREGEVVFLFGRRTVYVMWSWLVSQPITFKRQESQLLFLSVPSYPPVASGYHTGTTQEGTETSLQTIKASIDRAILVMSIKKTFCLEVCGLIETIVVLVKHGFTHKRHPSPIVKASRTSLHLFRWIWWQFQPTTA